MKNRASSFLKQMFSVIIAIAKAKLMAVKSKTSTKKTRFLIFALLCNKKYPNIAISHKIHALIGKENEGEDSPVAEYDSKMIEIYSMNKALESNQPTTSCNKDDNYTDLTHSLFDLELEANGLGDGTGSVIDLVKNAWEDASGFSLDDEVDNVADVFIRRFHKKMRIQRLESFKKHQETIATGIQI